MNGLIKKVNSFYYLSFLLVINGGLITFLTKGTPFTIWRQLITIIGVFILFWTLKNVKEKSLRFVLKSYLVIISLLFICCIIGYFFQGYSILRIVYSLWGYVVGFPIIIFPILLTKEKNFNPRRFFAFFSHLGVFLSLGLFIDSQTSIFKFINLSINGLENSSEQYIDIYTSRCSFLAETVTTFGVFLSFTILSSLYLLSVTNNIKKKLYLYFASFIPLVGSWFTGSRQIFIVVFITLFFGLLAYLKQQKKELKYFMMSLCIIVPLILSYVIPLMVENKELLSRYVGDNEGVVSGDEERVAQWIRGSEYIIDNGYVVLFGNGMGSFAVKGVNRGELKTEHYENTYLMRIIDTGFIGLWTILFPVYVILRNIYVMRRKNILDKLSLCIIFCYLFTSFISPNGASPSTQYIMFVLAGIYLVRNKFELK